MLKDLHFHMKKINFIFTTQISSRWEICLKRTLLHGTQREMKQVVVTKFTAVAASANVTFNLTIFSRYSSEERVNHRATFLCINHA